MSTPPLLAHCPDCEPLEHADGPLMPSWASLLQRAAAEAGAALLEQLRLPAGPAADLVRGLRQVALWAPRAPERRDSLRRRTLIVTLADERPLLFRGNEHSLPFGWPPDYRSPLARLGLLALGPEDEIFVDGGTEARAIARHLEAAGQTPPAGLRPFYTDGRYRYSCWTDGDFSRTWFFDRETSRLAEESDGGFPGWLATRLVGPAAG